MTGVAIIPELALADPAAGAELLCRVFGFRPEAPGLLRLGDQRVTLVAGRPQGHGTLHHLALAVDDLPGALAAALDRGGRLEPAETPDGPQRIPEFWAAGADYVFVEGPEGARIELCARPGTDRPGLPGHDHLGIACRDLAAVRAFFLDLGLTEIAATTLRRPAGDVAVCFLGTGSATVELYRPATAPVPATAPFWQRLRMTGIGAMRIGPEGLVVVPAVSP